MVGAVAALDSVRPEELEEACRYGMEIDWSDGAAVFVVSFPAAHGVMTHGATRTEAAAQGEDALIS